MRQFLKYLHRIRFTHFLVIGGLNTLVGYALYALLITLGLHYAWAVLLATILGVIFNFFTTGRLVFRSATNRLFGRFIMVYTIIYAVNIGLIRLLHSFGLNDYYAGAVAVPIVAVFAFILNKNFVFASMPTDEVKKSIAEALDKIPTNEQLGRPLFDAISRHSISVAFEAVWLREKNDVIEVFLRKRAENDTAYPGQWHLPGSVFRPGEQPDDVAKRISEKELHIKKFTRAQFVQFFFVPTTTRGWFECLVHLVESDQEPHDEKGKWYLTTKLPDNTIDMHRDLFIPCAVKAYLAKK